MCAEIFAGSLSASVIKKREQSCMGSLVWWLFYPFFFVVVYCSLSDVNVFVLVLFKLADSLRFTCMLFICAVKVVGLSAKNNFIPYGIFYCSYSRELKI